MLLASKSPKYLGMDEGILNVKLLQKLYPVVGYNLAKSRAARDTTNNRPPAELHVGANVLVKKHTARSFEPKFKDYCVVQLLGSGKVIVKDNHGKLTTFHRRDVKPIDMDIKIAEFFQEERNTTTRDANYIMPKAKIPDLDWKNYTPPTVTEVDILAIEQGQVEHLECNCLDCFSEVAELHEIEDTTALPQQQEKSSIWVTVSSLYRNLFQPAYTPSDN